MKNLVNDGEDVALVEDNVGGAVDRNLRAAVFCDENLVVNGYIEGDFLAVFVAAAGAEGTNDGFLGFLFGAVRQEKAAGGFGLSFYSLYEYACSDGLNHGIYMLFSVKIEGGAPHVMVRCAWG